MPTMARRGSHDGAVCSLAEVVRDCLALGGLVRAAATVPVGEHPAEGAQDWAFAPARRRATALHRAHLLYESTDDREEEENGETAGDESLHDHTLHGHTLPRFTGQVR